MIKSIDDIRKASKKAQKVARKPAHHKDLTDLDAKEEYFEGMVIKKGEDKKPEHQRIIKIVSDEMHKKSHADQKRSRKYLKQWPFATPEEIKKMDPKMAVFTDKANAADDERRRLGKKYNRTTYPDYFKKHMTKDEKPKNMTKWKKTK